MTQMMFCTYCTGLKCKTAITRTAKIVCQSVISIYSLDYLFIFKKTVIHFINITIVHGFLRLIELDPLMFLA